MYSLKKMNIAVPENTGECSSHRTWAVWISILFADFTRSQEVTRLAGVLLKLTSSVCPGIVL